MPLSITKRNDKEYLYFKINGLERIYLGTVQKPNTERIKDAIYHLNQKINTYKKEKQKLEGLITGVVQKEEFNIKYKLIIFDLDGVIFNKPWHGANTSVKTAVSTWDVLFQSLGHYDIHEKYRDQYERGFFKSYLEWTENACAFFKSIGLTREKYEEVINNRKFTHGAKEVFQVLSKNITKVAVITGSFNALAKRAKRELENINFLYSSCKFIFNKEGLLNNWKINPTDYNHKARIVQKLIKELGLDRKDCAYIGDDVNDIPAFGEVGIAIAFNSNKNIVRKKANIIIDSIDLQSILPHLSR